MLVVGAGAAGLAVGIFAARGAAGLRIAILDGARTIGAKMMVAGGGRCNVTNARVAPADYYGGNRHILKRVLGAFDERATRAFFEEIGVSLHEEEYGKLFPDSNSGRAVVGALLAELDRRRVRVYSRHRVMAVRLELGGGFVAEVMTPTGVSVWRCRRLVLATGGLSLPKTGSDGAGYGFARALGHTVVPTTPALDPLVLSGTFHSELSGISHEVALTFRAPGRKAVRIAGPVLWTHFGLSGPAALNVSRFWQRARLEGAAGELTANLAGGATFEGMEVQLLDVARTHPKARVGVWPRLWLPTRVAEEVVRATGVDPQKAVGHLSRESRRRLARALTVWPLPVVGTRGYGHAEVTAGGVPLVEVDSRTMASRRCKGLYLAGEILDVDGRIGGFNFQWAWSSAWVVGAALSKPETVAGADG